MTHFDRIAGNAPQESAGASGKDVQRYPWGAQCTAQGVSYGVWAPSFPQVCVHIWPKDGSAVRTIATTADGDGFQRAFDPAGVAGDAYQFELRDMLVPDPASRAQQATVHGPSLVVDATKFGWSDAAWVRPAFRDLVIYELHVGTFSRQGTFRGVIERLAYLADLGVNAIEIMPIADFPGNRSWGYDGVLIYAPAHAYGSPDDLRALVDAAHAHGIAVILDVVYNHFGPDGNYWSMFSRNFFNEARQTPWGAAIHFDGPGSAVVRDFFLGNVAYWMRDFHIDGFRLDATHEIFDDSPRHILSELAEVIQQRGGYVLAEDARNDAALLMPRGEGGCGFDAVWADDFHHAVRVSQTHESESYYGAYTGELGEIVDTLQHGWHYRGQIRRPSGRKRGTECRSLPPSAFLHCISNHDQVGNRACGDRLHESITPDAYRALSLLLCLTPYTPMMFMGQEWASSSPFQFFTDHHEELGRLVTDGRQREFAAFAAFRDPLARACIPDPQADETFFRSKLKWEELGEPPFSGVLALYREALALRRKHPAFRPASRDGWVVGELVPGIGAVRFEEGREVYLLLFDLNGGGTVQLGQEGISELPAEKRWRAVLSSNETRFGGEGQRSYDLGRQMVNFATREALLLVAEPSALGLGRGEPGESTRELVQTTRELV